MLHMVDDVPVGPRGLTVSTALGGGSEQGGQLPWVGHPPAQLLVLLWLLR